MPSPSHLRTNLPTSQEGRLGLAPPCLYIYAPYIYAPEMQDNKAALAYLYQTGVFYFALAYCGSNLLEIASLFQVTPPLDYSSSSQ